MARIDARVESHYKSLARAIDFTKVADAKAAPVVVLHVALIGALAFRSEPLLGILSQRPWDACGVMLLAALAIYISVSALAIFSAGRVFLPRTPREGKSLIYFEDIANMDYESFIKQSKELNKDVIEEQLLQQIFVVSGIASKKMQRVRCALILSGIALVLWVSLIGVSAVQ